MIVQELTEEQRQLIVQHAERKKRFLELAQAEDRALQSLRSLIAPDETHTINLGVGDYGAVVDTQASNEE